MSFLFQFLKPGDPYYPNWVDMRRRALIAWLTFAAWAPATALLALLLGAALRLRGALLWAAVPTTLVFIAARVYATSWPCPRCGRPFYRSWWVYWPFANNCLPCGLPEYASSGE
jgi:hypothetical protein